jgi:chromosome segregation ATPase
VIESIMFFALGFLAASLVALILLSAVWHRAVRLTTKRIEGAIPVSMAEIQADKDQLRAEFAMSTRRLEMSVEGLKLKTTEQFAEIGRKNETIRLLKVQADEKSALAAALEAQEKTLREKLKSTEEEFATKSKELHAAESELRTKATEMAQLARALADKAAQSDSRATEIKSLQGQCENLKDRIASLEREIASTEDRMVEERGKVDHTSRTLADERGKADTLTRRVAEMEDRTAEGRQQAESLSRNIANLETETRRQAELAAQRETEVTGHLAQREAQLIESRREIEVSRAEAAALHREIESASRSYGATIEALKAEKSLNEGALAQVREDRDRLQQEVATLKQQAESNWASERVESALLRERINDVAAEVVRLAANLEGSASPIQRILDQPAPKPARPNGGGGTKHGAAETNGGERPLTLAERIRALQSRSGRT